MNSVIRVEDLSKQYRLGNIGTGSIAHDVNRWWHTIRGKPDPYMQIGDENDRTIKGESEYVWALQNINFEVKRGDTLGIIGRNGAGKSTLLKILSRTTSPTKGLIKIDGRVASLLEVGTGFHPDLSGRENIFLNGAILGMRKEEIKRKFDEIVDFAGIERYIDTPVKRYSSGMYVRLAFGVAAHLDPDILIVDEVLAVGDAEFQKKCLGKMKDVSEKDGRTILFVSHDMEAISKLTQHAILLRNGKIFNQGLTPDIIRDYSSLNKSSNLIYENSQDHQSPYISRIEVKSSLPNNIQINGSEMEILLEVVTPQSIKGACISIQMVDAKDRNFVHVWIFDEDIEYCREKGTYHLICKIPSIKLYMGNYFLKCYFAEPPGGKIFEIVEYACPFQIVMYETEKSQYNWYPEACAYMESFSWKVSKIN